MSANVLSAAQIAHLAHAALGEVPPADPLLVLVQADDDGVSFMVPPPGSGSLFDQLLCLEAPAEVGAIAVAAAGRAWSLDPQPAALPVDVVVGYALLRSGSSATYVTGPDGPVELDDLGVGRVPDLCHRALGLPTPAPEVETDAHLTRNWLDALLREATGRPGELTWSDAISLHPVAEAAELELPQAWMQLAVDTFRFATVVPWSVLRRRFADQLVDEACSHAPGADLAAWLDDGSFSRWMLDPLPTPEEAWPLLEQLVPQSVLREVRASVELAEALGQPEDEWDADGWDDHLWEEERWDNSLWDDEDDDPRLDGWVNPCS